MPGGGGTPTGGGGTNNARSSGHTPRTSPPRAHGAASTPRPHGTASSPARTSGARSPPRNSARTSGHTHSAGASPRAQSAAVSGVASATPVEEVRRRSNTSDPLGNIRTVNLNAAQPNVYIRNTISTAKYTALTFVPAFLFEQFRRYSNIFFLAIALLQQIPDVSPTGRYTTLVPLLCILSVSAVKEIIEDVKRHKADGETNRREVEVLRNGNWTSIKWSHVAVGDFVKVLNEKFFPADLVLFSSSERSGICYIETSNLDGETNLKIRQSLTETSNYLEPGDLQALQGFLECELPNRNLYEFMGRLKFSNREDLALGPDQILLRGAKLQNTGFIVGLVVYTGHESKLMKNSTVAPLKRSTVDKRTNTQIIMLFILLIIVSLTSALFSVFIVDNDALSWYIPELKDFSKADSLHKAKTFMYSTLTFVILYNNLIPISLTVTLEVVRFIQALFINWDEDMIDLESKTHALARTSNLNEELGEVSYIFSDKTGTLTRNIMEFKACSVFGKMYLPGDLLEGKNLLVEDLLKSHNSQQKSDIREFLLLLSICHNVIPDYSQGEGLENVLYHAQSPDERALVYGAQKLGYAFLHRTPHSVTISALGNEETYDIVNILEFSSARKRMSVIVRGPDGKLKLYCKGADSMIFERLAKTPGSSSSHTTTRSNLEQKTAEHLDEYSKQGLRCLCCAVADIPLSVHEDWEKIFHHASTSLHDRERKIDEAAELIEKDLRLLGATAIEDKLQDQVPETIAAFMQAGISVWVLTGDKQETAINIGYSCRLLKEEMELFLVNRDNLQGTQDCIREFMEIAQALEVTLEGSHHHHGHLKDRVDAAVIVDGATLKFAVLPPIREEFLQLCCKCKAVIVCRASPMQKAEIVEYVTKKTGAITLAIGDGANDVAMIQKAHVGVGISGVEGLQAACASDYAISQFRFLKKLLFVHGAWNFDRMCKLIFYSFYKNICLYVIELWFAAYSGWSGQIIFERWTIGLYNMLFTCAQPIAIGLFERNCSQDMRMRYPMLYIPSKNAFSLKMFFAWVANSLVHSVIIFWLTWALYGDGIVWGAGIGWGGFQGGYLVLGNFIYTYVVVVVSLKSGLITKSWTIFTHVSIWGSILLWMLFLLVYSYLFAIHIPGITLGADICGVAEMVFTSSVFWIGLIVVPVATLLPDLVVKGIENSIYKSLDDAFRECEVLKKDADQLMRDRIKKDLRENTDCLEDMEELFRACLTCDSFNLLQRYRCCCLRKRSKTSPQGQDGTGNTLDNTTSTKTHLGKENIRREKGANADANMLANASSHSFMSSDIYESPTSSKKIVQKTGKTA